MGPLWQIICGAVYFSDHKLYVIIDDYDNFTNDILDRSKSDLYEYTIRTSGFYESLKAGTTDVIDRIFITGTSPILLYDFTISFNIADHITLSRHFNKMMGFTSPEVQSIIQHFIPKDDQEKINDDITNNYSGYLFNEDAEDRVYNPAMTLYHLRELQSPGYSAKKLIDESLKTNYGCLNSLISNGRKDVLLEQIIQDESIMTRLEGTFSLDTMYDEKYFASLLFYLGFLTIDRQDWPHVKLKVPNYAIKSIFGAVFDNYAHNSE